jgi:hypothetical protein
MIWIDIRRLCDVIQQSVVYTSSLESGNAVDEAANHGFERVAQAEGPAPGGWATPESPPAGSAAPAAGALASSPSPPRTRSPPQPPPRT